MTKNWWYKATALILTTFLCACSTNEMNPYWLDDSFPTRPDFEWAPDSFMWENNIRDCRSAPQCSAADLFDRV